MDYVGLLFRWMHILPAAIMVGGSIFLRFAIIGKLQPATAESNGFFDREPAARQAWARLVMACSAFLLISGLYNAYARIMGFQLPPIYHAMVGIKLLVGLATFYLAAVLAGRSARAQRCRQSEKFWGSMLVLLATASLLLGGLMRGYSIEAPKKTPKEVARFFESGQHVARLSESGQHFESAHHTDHASPGRSN